MYVINPKLTGIICFCICNDLQRVLKAHLPNVQRAHRVIGLLYPQNESLCLMSDLLWAQIPSQVVVLVSCAGAALGGYDWSILKCHLELWAGQKDSAVCWRKSQWLTTVQILACMHCIWTSVWLLVTVEKEKLHITIDNTGRRETRVLCRAAGCECFPY